MRKALLVSVVVNALFILLCVFGIVHSRSTASVSFLNLDAGDVRYTTGVCVVSVPEHEGVVFAPVEFSLTAGARAALQFSALAQGRQLTVAVEPLYDHAVVAVEPSAYGLIIRALAPGTALLQTITGEGIRDIARVTVKAGE